MMTFKSLSQAWIKESGFKKYSYHFQWLGRPIIQYPQDICGLQELIWQVKPDLIVETGIAHGGSLVFSASMLALLDYCEAVEEGVVLDPQSPKRRVLGVDVDIRSHNRDAIAAHPMANRIEMLQGSSTDAHIIAKVRDVAKRHEKVFVCLDSNHTHDHVLEELELYAPLTSRESYCCVFDTIIQDMPDDMFPGRPWGKSNNPKTAVWEYLHRLNSEGRTAMDGLPLKFEIDNVLEEKLMITVAPDGYLKRVD